MRCTALSPILQFNLTMQYFYGRLYKVCEMKNIKKKKKTQDIKVKVWLLVSQKWLGQFPSNLVCELLYPAGSKPGSNWIRDHGTTYEMCK